MDAQSCDIKCLFDQVDIGSMREGGLGRKRGVIRESPTALFILDPGFVFVFVVVFVFVFVFVFVLGWEGREGS